MIRFLQPVIGIKGAILYAGVSIYKSEKENTNKMMSYFVFPGIEFIGTNVNFYNYKNKQHTTSGNFILINYCFDGHIEWEIEKDRYFYLNKGDLSIQMYNFSQKNHFPHAHCHGIFIMIDISKVASIEPMLNSFGVDLSLFTERFCGKDKFYVERANTTIEHIFSGIYTIPDQIKSTYIKIKVLELLLFLSVLKKEDYCHKQVYIKKSDIKKMKGVREYLITHIDRRITTRDLSKHFSVSETSMKMHFKSIYGMPLYTFIRTHRIQKAAWLLKNTNDSITNIALAIGYNNASKFSAAFKNEIGLTPSDYRKELPDWSLND